MTFPRNSEKNSSKKNRVKSGNDKTKKNKIQIPILPFFVLSFSITETSEITSTIKAKLQTMLMSVRARSKPVRRFHQFGFLKERKGIRNLLIWFRIVRK